MKKNEKNATNPENNQSLVQFWSIFDHKHNFIEAANPYIDRRTGKLRKTKRGKLKPDWRTETDFAIRPRVLEATFFDPTELIGLGFDSTTNKATIDIDHLSQYDPSVDEAAFNAVLGSLEDIGLCRPFYERSSVSKGLHVWYVLDEKINTFNLACAIQEKLKDDGFNIKSGQLELFPNAKSYKQDRKKSFYKAIKLPLQPQTGSYLLDGDFNPIDNTIDGFVQRAAWSQAGNDVALLKRASKKYSNRVRLQRCGRSRKSLNKLQQDLLRSIDRGFTGKGQTNDLLLDIGAFGVIFLRLDEDQHLEDLKDWMCQKVKDLDGYAQYCGHQRDIERRCLEVAKSCQDYYWAAGKPRKRERKTFRDNFDKVLNSVENGREAEKVKATQKIEKAIEFIDREIRQGLRAIPQTLTEYSKTIIQISRDLFDCGVSKQTLYKAYNKPLWQAAFAALAAIQIIATEPAQAQIEVQIEAPVQATAIAEVTVSQPIDNQIDVNVESQLLEDVDLEYSVPCTNDFESESLPEGIKKSGQNAPSLPAKITQNETVNVASESELLPPSKPPQSQSTPASTPCEQKSTLSKSPEPSETQASTPSTLYGGFGGAQPLDGGVSFESATSESAGSISNPSPSDLYYARLLARYPRLNALERARSDPEYQAKASDAFARIRAILGRSRHKNSSRLQSSDSNIFNVRGNLSADVASKPSDEAGGSLPSKPT